MTEDPETLTPLITAAEIFPRLEQVVWNAGTEVFLSFRIFDPETRLRSPALIEKGLTDWGDLLAHVAGRGVIIRLIVTDFDALFASALHRTAWSNASGFAGKLSGDSDVLCAPHGQFAGQFWTLALRRKISAKLRQLRDDPSDALTDIQRDMLQSGPVLRPVTLHQKFAVADGENAILGGLDIDERRWDDPEHDRDPDETWHDVSLGVRGRLCKDIRAHFVNCWNAALDCGAPSLMRKGEPLPAEPLPVSDKNRLPRLVRTMSMPRQAMTALGPNRHITEHEEALSDAFAAAQDHIYIETQFFRHRPLAEALARAGRDNPELQLIMLMPTEPERIVFGGDDGFDARHAQALQVRNLDLCWRAFGDRLAVISPAQPKSADPDQPGELHGADIVYVHAKVTLIDDCWGLVGSANLNGRSMRWDTEASIAFDDPETVRGLRERLAAIWLADHRDLADARKAATWNQAARANKARPPEARSGFVLPYPMARNRRFATFLPILPAEMF